MLVIKLSGKARKVWAKWDLVIRLCGNMTLGEYARLQESNHVGGGKWK